MSTNSHNELDATDCINHIRSDVTATEFGYKIQALAGHVLLRLGYRIEALNRAGHPDIIAMKQGKEYRFEVEAEVGRPHPRKLSDEDFASLLGVPDGFGYYALAVISPAPHWILVRASKLVNRKRSSSKPLLNALSDKTYSAEWTAEYRHLLNVSCRRIKWASFNQLSELALQGRGL